MWVAISLLKKRKEKEQGYPHLGLFWSIMNFEDCFFFTKSKGIFPLKFYYYYYYLQHKWNIQKKKEEKFSLRKQLRTRHKLKSGWARVFLSLAQPGPWTPLHWTTVLINELDLYKELSHLPSILTFTVSENASERFSLFLKTQLRLPSK